MLTDNQSKIEPLVVSIPAAGRLLGISRATAYVLVQQGRLPAIRISDRRWIIPKKAIEELLASKKE